MSNEKNSHPNWRKVIRIAIGRNAAKWLERELKITPDQAKRIAWSGHVPEHILMRFLDALAGRMAQARLEWAWCDEVIREADCNRVLSAHRHRALCALEAATTSEANRRVAEAD